MSQTITLACPIHFRGRGRGNRRCLEVGPEPKPVTREPGRVPRAARLLALALCIDEQVRKGELTSFSEVAVLGHVTRARVSEIMNLLNLATDIKEAILFLPRTERGRDANRTAGLAADRLDHGLAQAARSLAATHQTCSLQLSDHSRSRVPPAAGRRQVMRKSPQEQVGHSGLHCWKCGGRRFRVIYTRAAARGKIIRRRACRECGRRITTWERVIGG